MTSQLSLPIRNAIQALEGAWYAHGNFNPDEQMLSDLIDKCLRARERLEAAILAEIQQDTKEKA